MAIRDDHRHGYTNDSSTTHLHQGQIWSNVSSEPPSDDGFFVFDLPGIQAAIDQWTQLKSDLERDREIAQTLFSVAPPGNEPASRQLVQQLGYSVSFFALHNAGMAAFAEKYIEHLTDVRRCYLGIDDEASGRAGSVLRNMT